MSAQSAARQERASARWSDFYLTTMRTQIQTQFQYRAATYMYLVGMVAEPVIYLVVWTTIADAARRLGRRASRRASSPRTTSSGRSSGT